MSGVYGCCCQHGSGLHILCLDGFQSAPMKDKGCCAGLPFTTHCICAHGAQAGRRFHCSSCCGKCHMLASF